MVKIKKLIPMDTTLDITGATLLSAEEFERCKENVPPLIGEWWLRSKGSLRNAIARIYTSCPSIEVWEDGWANFHGMSVDHEGIYYDDEQLIRPVLILKNTENMKVGEQFLLGGSLFTVISDHLAISNKPIGKSIFDESTNEYNESSIKKTIEQWFDKLKGETTDVETMVTNILHDIRVPEHIKGYQYLREAIILAAEDMEAINAITNVLYLKIAKNFSTTPSRVEHAIRYAIEVTWERGDLDTLQRFFGYTASSTRGKPTNSEFIAMVADHVCIQLEEARKTK